MKNRVNANVALPPKDFRKSPVISWKKQLEGGRTKFPEANAFVVFLYQGIANSQ